MEDTAVEDSPDDERQQVNDDCGPNVGGECNDEDVRKQVEAEYNRHPAHPAQVNTFGKRVCLGDLLGVTFGIHDHSYHCENAETDRIKYV